MIDVHAHMCWESYGKDIEEIILRCKQELAGVVASSARYEEGLKVLSLAEKHPNFIFPSIGFHPVEGGDNPGRIMKMIMSNKERIVGIGEVGLDYHWEKDPEKRKIQRERFSKFIDLAEKLSKPLVIHSWDAERECFDMVKDSDVKCVFHCFGGKRDLAREISSKGFYISISTMVLSSKNVRKVAKDVPMNRLLLETDSPFLSPNKNERNYPWNIKLSAEKIAGLRKISKEDVLEAAKRNAIEVFNLKIS